MTPDQCIAARELLGWSREQLVTASGCRLETVTIFEMRGTRSHQSTRRKLHAAFELAGVEFIAENGGGPGVRFRKDGER